MQGPLYYEEPEGPGIPVYEKRSLEEGEGCPRLLEALWRDLGGEG